MQQDELHPVSKFVEAMKNPNWRTRYDLDEGEGPSFEPRGSHIVSGLRESDYMLGLRYAKGASRSESSERRHHSSSDDTTGHQNNQWTHVQLQKVPVDGGSLKYHQNMTSNAVGQCQLLKEKILPGFPDLRLIELRPTWPSSDDGQETRILDLHHQKSVSSTWQLAPHQNNQNKCDEQSEQFAAAMGAADKTPRRVKPAISPPTLAGSSDVPNDTSSTETRHKHAILKDPAIANIGRLKNTERSNEPALKGEARDEAQRKEHLTNNNHGGPSFQKLLAKLHRGPRGASSRRSSPITDPKTKPQLDAPQEAEQSVYRFEGPSAGGRRHNDNMRSSDSGYGSSNSGGAPGIANSTNNTSSNVFNPKAREFLSFTAKHQKPEVGQNPPRYRRIPVEELFARKDHDTRPDNGFDVPMIAPSDEAPPTYSGNPEDTPGAQGFPMPTPLVDTGALFNLWSPIAALNYPASPYPNASTSWASNQTPSHVVPPLAMLPGSNWPLGMFNHAATGANFIPLPGTGMTPPLDMLAGTGANTTSTAPGISHAPVPRPAPVPKPRKPDPGNQQAYEAWIEWRKANEPGYAMECKLRQQRRSQRNTASKSKSETTSKSEVPTTV